MTATANSKSAAGNGPAPPAPRIALVTGGAQRIGAAIARELALSGTAVAIHYHSSRLKADALAGEIDRAGGKALVFGADLTDPASVAGLFGEVRGALGPVDLLVNNASVFLDDSAADFEQDKWDAHFAIHVRAPSQLIGLQARQDDLEQGLAVNMIDQRVWRLTPRFHSYTLSKSAMWTATRTLAQALAPKLRVNAIGPGPTLPNERQSQEDFDRQQAGLLLGRGPDLQEFADAIGFLWRARSVTGQMIALDGGQHLAWETPDVAGIHE